MKHFDFYDKIMQISIRQLLTIHTIPWMLHIQLITSYKTVGMCEFCLDAKYVACSHFYSNKQKQNLVFLSNNRDPMKGLVIWTLYPGVKTGTYYDCVYFHEAMIHKVYSDIDIRRQMTKI